MPPPLASGSSPTGSAATRWEPSAGRRRAAITACYRRDRAADRSHARAGGARSRLVDRDRRSGSAPTSGTTGDRSAGHGYLDGVRARDGVPSWRWSVGAVVLEAELAMVHGRPRSVSCTGWCGRSARSGRGSMSRRCAPGATRTASAARRERTGGGAHGGRFRVRGRVPGARSELRPRRRRGSEASPSRGSRPAGLNAVEDLWFAGRFAAALAPGDATLGRGVGGRAGTPRPRRR